MPDRRRFQGVVCGTESGGDVMEWEECELKDLITRLVDYRGKTPKKTQEGVKLITAKVIKDGHILDNVEHEYIAEENYDEAMRRGIPQINDIIVTTEAPLGEVAMITNDEKIALAQRVILFTPDIEKVSPQFLYYSFFTKLIQERLQARATGTTVPGISNPSLQSIKFPTPPLPIQSRIAEVLGRYDALIENYRRQIGILEAAAQTLYREWFVRGRCPYARYEDNPKLPVGWKRLKFTDVISIQSGGTPKTDNAQFWDGDIFWFSPADLEDAFYVLSTEKTISESGLKNCNSKLYPTNTVVITARGTVGRCILLGRPMAINQSNYALIGKTVSQYFVFFKSLELADKWKKEAIGAVFEAITVNNFERTAIVLPTVEVLESFDKVIEPILNKIRNCLEQIELLRQMRDKLLPRLLSGQIQLTASG
jgi:type I restriction enzyme S subunit